MKYIKRISAAKAAFVLCAVLMLLTAFLIHDDYGFTIDERAERNSTLVNYQFVLKTLFGHEVRVVDQDLTEFKDRYYGVALQMPMAVAEHLMHFQMPLHDVYTMRHLYCACLCIAGWICFYFFCQKALRSDWLALLGMLMVWLYPRFFGEQFTNIKDMVFAAVFSAGLLTVALCLENEGKWRYEVLTAFAGALSTNTRVLGLMPFGLLFGYRVLRDGFLLGLRGKAFWKNMLRYVAQLAMLFAFYILITPIAWTDPIGFFPKVLSTFSNYTAWAGQVYFLGTAYPASQLPWYYIPAWIGLSVPLWYLALSAASVPAQVKGAAEAFRGGRRKMTEWLLSDSRWYALCAVIVLLPLCAAAVRDTTLYHAWRHMYFLLPPLVVTALFGMRSLWRLMDKRRALRAVCGALACVLLASQAVWIVRQHPMEKVFFNAFGRRYADQLDKDYWCESTYDVYRMILRCDPSDRICVADYGYTDFTWYYFATDVEKQRLHLTPTASEETEYIISVVHPENQNAFEGFALIHEYQVDGVTVSRVFLREDVLADRFGGVYPE